VADLKEPEPEEEAGETPKLPRAGTGLSCGWGEDMLELEWLAVD
jgi:hypothetical protein